jgi:hypothetical protein
MSLSFRDTVDEDEDEGASERDVDSGGEDEDDSLAELSRRHVG